MGIQINGNTDIISATDGSLTIQGADFTAVAAGSTAAPSISPTGDSNTGIFFPSADTVAIAEGGAEALRIDSSGRLGIGTATPTVAGSRNTLTVNGASGADFYLHYNGSEVLSLQATAATMVGLNYPSSGTFNINRFGTIVANFDNSGNFAFNSGYGSAAIAYGVRAWVRFNGTGSNSTNQTINGSGNVSTVFKNATGDYTVNFTNAFVDANYAVTHAGGIQYVEWGIHLRHNSVAPTTSAYRFKNVTPNDLDRDVAFINLAFYR